jgi:hypothetical protein
MKNSKTIKRFSSSFDDTLTLVEVVDNGTNFIVRVMGEPDLTFSEERQAVHYAMQKAVEFYD